ncbi:Holliday junction branch migration DNA helicase RuvB [Candidatus Mycoplasma haematominutum]|uniref:Holliday junction branch migration complex subunit RuvB n=1 Tax=Candidatus Mycoplasma haematominutum 'Birmingham 1' TaxID=1116213 RepID=G8C3W9_9MOLU|nr:Holliday junction branch migration DNA helicase RuvB [Candidatus Mycoplasma haematominutum]CCE67017.1 Holliday junction DNA helicase RuvB [Candidatus Mycoplasma haematominutum 'Birmingham 1']
MTFNFELLKLRPSSLKEFVGKPEIVKSIQVGVEVAKKLNKPLEHTLFYGPPGVGKTSLAQIIANELKVNIKIVPATNIQILPDLIGVMSSLKDFDVLFIDEIHSLKVEYIEMLYSAMEDNVLDLLVGKSCNSKAIRVNLPKFTLIAATTNLGALPKALEERFGYIFFVDCYTDAEIKTLINQLCKKWTLFLNKKEIEVIVSNSRGIPRNAKRILRRVLDYKTINKGCSLQEVIKECGFTFQGLTELDLKYLRFLEKSHSYIAGIKSIVQGTNLDESTLMKKIEPFLIFKGYVSKTFRGRILTEKGVELLSEFQKQNFKNL